MRGLGHIGDAGGKHALFTGDLLVNEVGHAVGRQAQVLCAHRIAQAAEVLPAHHVPQSETHVEAAIGQLGDAAGEQGVGPALAPGAEIGAGGFVQTASDGVDKAELAAALQVGAHDGGDVFAGSLVAAKTHGRKRKLGEANAGHFNPKLGLGGEWPAQQREGGNQAERAASRNQGRRVVSVQIQHAECVACPEVAAGAGRPAQPTDNNGGIRPSRDKMCARRAAACGARLTRHSAECSAGRHTLGPIRF